jgi:transposase
MKLTFIPAPGSPYRVIAADDPQPAGSWSERVLACADSPPPTCVLAPSAPGATPSGDPHAPAATPPDTASDAVVDAAAPHAAANLPDFLGPLPPLSCSDCPDRSGFLQARQQAGYYRSLAQRAKKREEHLKVQVAELEAEIRILKQRLFGSKSESRHAPDCSSAPTPADPLAENAPSTSDTSPPSASATSPRKRGQQQGQKMPQRRDYSHLPVITEERVLAPEQSCCSCCGHPFAPAGFEEDSTILEIEVKAYRRCIRRRRYRRLCSCQGQPRIIATPVVPRVLPHSRFGVSVWVQILLDKYHYCRPTAKQLDDLRSHGLDLSAGTITGDLKRLAPLFDPLYQKLLERSREQALWNADETRWPVFQVVSGKVGYRWYVWLFESKDSVVFTLDKGRAHEVPENHFGKGAVGILVVDRYSAYKAMKHVKEGRLRLAFCWAHQRRDFLDAEKSWPKLSEWAAQWVARIGQLYRRNDDRSAAKEKSADREEKDKRLREAVETLRQRWEEELADEKLHPASRKVLSSMKEHWEGLTIFVDVPAVPMDNNRGERTLRIAALARKNYYGSGAEWSGKLAAWMFSLLATLLKWGINRRKWLSAYLQACAQAGGKVPQDADRWLPWNLTAEQKKEVREEEEATEESQERDQQQ